MLETTEKIVSHYQVGDYKVIIIFLIVSLAFNAFSILNAYHAIRKRRVTDLESIIESQYISSDFKKMLREDIESEHFKVVYGVRASKDLIEKTFMLHNNLDGKISFAHFARAIKIYPKVIRDSNNKYQFKIGLWDIAFGLYHLISGIVITLAGIITLIIQIITDPLVLSEYNILLPLIVVAGGIYMLFMSGPYYSLMVINRSLKSNT